MTDATRLQNSLARVSTMPTSKIVQYLAMIVSDPPQNASMEAILAAINALAAELDRRVPVPNESQP